MNGWPPLEQKQCVYVKDLSQCVRLYLYSCITLFFITTRTLVFKKPQSRQTITKKTPPEYLTLALDPVWRGRFQISYTYDLKMIQFFKWPSWKRIFLVNDLFLFLLCCFSWSQMKKTHPSKLVYSFWISIFNSFLWMKSTTILL